MVVLPHKRQHPMGEIRSKELMDMIDSSIMLSIDQLTANGIIASIRIWCIYPLKGWSKQRERAVYTK